MWEYRTLTRMVQADDPRPEQAEVLPAVKGKYGGKEFETFNKRITCIIKNVFEKQKDTHYEIVKSANKQVG